MNDIWHRKILAHLHDPPDKGYDFGLRHKQRADQYRNRAAGAESWQGHEPDHLAAAADRFIFPSGRAINKGLGAGLHFVHPFAGGAVDFNFPTADHAGDILGDMLPVFSGVNAKQQFFHLWRCWMHFAACHHEGQRGGAETIPYLPADTRIADHSIWHHNSIVSAIEAARDVDGKVKPAFLLFQLGPVQEFIAQARSVRDAWSGSYLLSWMMAHALKVVTDRYGPDNVIFPALRGQPLFDWLHKDVLENARYDGSESFWETLGLEHHQDLVLTPSFPNRLFAVVSEDFDPEEITRTIMAEWKNIADACHPFLGLPEKCQAHWDFQVAHFWQPTWQMRPWQSADTALRAYRDIPTGEAGKSILHNSAAVAEAIRTEHRDGRCYPLNAGWAWAAQFQLLSHALDARRQTRNFDAWMSIDQTAGKIKDAWSGKEEALIDEEWFAMAQQNGQLKHLFRKADKLGAVNLIKRVWHKAYLEKTHRLTRTRRSFDSVPAVAAAPWVNALQQKLSSEGSVWEALIDFQQAVQPCADLPIDLESTSINRESEWIGKMDAAVWQESSWDRWGKELDNPSDQKMTDEAKRKLNGLIRKAGMGKPSNYFAVLALDGDHMGKWLNGDHAQAPPIRELMAPKAIEYFENEVPGGKEWLNSRRPISPSYHVQFSEALGHFGMYAVQRIIKAHHGQLIYSGGDDVLAMLPADEAIDCAQGLRMAFQGATELAQKYSDQFLPAEAGFIRLKPGRSEAEPTWPLLAPGSRATVSTGIAIAHIKEALQDVIEEARRAESRAKNAFDRNALAVTLFKRSGETIEWGAKFDSHAFPLLNYLRQYYRVDPMNPTGEKPISGQFPYRMAALLSKYPANEPMTDERLGIACMEVAWAVRQLKRRKEVPDLMPCCKTYLEELNNRKRPLSDFYHLFAVEAFIARQGA